MTQMLRNAELRGFFYLLQEQLIDKFIYQLDKNLRKSALRSICVICVPTSNQ